MQSSEYVQQPALTVWERGGSVTHGPGAPDSLYGHRFFDLLPVPFLDFGCAPNPHNPEEVAGLEKRHTFPLVNWVECYVAPPRCLRWLVVVGTGIYQLDHACPIWRRILLGS